MSRITIADPDTGPVECTTCGSPAIGKGITAENTGSTGSTWRADNSVAGVLDIKLQRGGARRSFVTVAVDASVRRDHIARFSPPENAHG